MERRADGWPARNSRTGLGRDCKGAAVIEYALLAALLSLSMLAGFAALGDRSGSLWATLAKETRSALGQMFRI